MQFHISYMQPEARQQVKYQSYDDITNAVWLSIDEQVSGDSDGEDFEKANTELVSKTEFITAIKQQTFTFWPINTGYHWAAIILHVEPVYREGSIDIISHYLVNPVIIEPSRDPPTMLLIWRRLKLIISQERGFQLYQNQPQDFYYPRQIDQFSCGLRVYKCMQELLERINEIETRERLDGNGIAGVWRLSNGPWQDMSWDFQPDKVRTEMIGILASEDMRKLSYEVRLGLVPCTSVRDEAGKLVSVSQASTHLSNLPQLSHQPQNLHDMRFPPMNWHQDVPSGKMNWETTTVNPRKQANSSITTGPTGISGAAVRRKLFGLPPTTVLPQKKQRKTKQDRLSKTKRGGVTKRTGNRNLKQKPQHRNRAPGDRTPLPMNLERKSSSDSDTTMRYNSDTSMPDATPPCSRRSSSDKRVNSSPERSSDARTHGMQTRGMQHRGPSSSSSDSM